MHYGQPLGSMRALERDLYHGQFCHDNQFTWEEADTWHQHQQPGPAIMRESLPPVLYCTIVYCTIVYCTVLLCLGPRHHEGGPAPGRLHTPTSSSAAVGNYSIYILLRLPIQFLP